MELIDRILQKVDKDRLVQNDLHIVRFYSAPVIVSGGKVIEVFEPTLQCCPLSNALYRNFRTLDKTDLLLFKKAVCENVEEKISQFGFFTENRKIYQKEISIPYGASEMLMYALKKGVIEAAVIVCDGAGTVLLGRRLCRVSGQG